MNYFPRIKNTFPALFKGMIALSALGLAVGVFVFIAYGIANSETEAAFAVLASCIGAIAALWFDFFVAGLFYFAAEDKGYADGVYMYLAFIVPPVGYLLVCALPTLNVITEKRERANIAKEEHAEEQPKQHKLFVPPADTNTGEWKETLYMQYFNDGGASQLSYSIAPYKDKYKIKSNEIQKHTLSRERGSITFYHKFKKYVFNYDLDRSALLAIRCTADKVEELTAHPNDT